MGDVYATITQVDETLPLAAGRRARAAAPPTHSNEPCSRTTWATCPSLPGARVLEVGCGTGAVASVLADRLMVDEVVGSTPRRSSSSGLASWPTPAEAHLPEGDGQDLPCHDGSIDAVVCHTSLCHIPSPDQVLAEAARVVADGGGLAEFEGDYATTMVVTGWTPMLMRSHGGSVALAVRWPER